MRDLRESLSPSGPPAARRRTYRYASSLQFLRRAAEHRQTSTSTREPEVPPEAAPVREPTAGSSGGSAPTEDTPGLLPESSPPVVVRQTVSSRFAQLLRRERSGRRRHRVWEDLTRVTGEALLRLDKRIMRFEDNVMRQLAGAGLAGEPSVNRLFVQTLIPVLDQMTPQRAHEARMALSELSWEMLHHPDFHPYPKPHTQPPTHSYHPSQAPDSTHSHQLSQTPAAVPYPTPSTSQSCLTHFASSPSSVAVSRKGHEFRAEMEGFSGRLPPPQMRTRTRHAKMDVTN
ncbi:hypothetical protein GDO81_021136 [Engystomops pustulosus]|nr:hypothetical protein GDO81_021136 [Engystomops pustulosus]KAG8545293.1 hypothetical protein GDO81_021136 [Engystomops pustulosus]KAG8545294.1 hypothetical protein GDO81_021136 [Engystomops pustulosus]